MYTVTLVAQKGGTGKTTLAINLAVAAEAIGPRTALVDLDPQMRKGDGNGATCRAVPMGSGGLGGSSDEIPQHRQVAKSRQGLSFNRWGAVAS